MAAGILVDIEYLTLFGIMMFRKAYFHFCPDPFLLEVHLFIEPFEFGDLLSITGITAGASAVSPGATGARVEAWCLLILVETFLSLSRSLSHWSQETRSN